MKVSTVFKSVFRVKSSFSEHFIVCRNTVHVLLVHDKEGTWTILSP